MENFKRENNGSDFVIEDGVLKKYNGQSDVVSIPDGVKTIGEFAFAKRESLKGVVIANSVTSIEKSAFAGCTGLTSVTIPPSVLSIGAFAFSNCAKLAKVFIPKTVKSLGAYAFDFCENLTVYAEDEREPIGWDEDWDGDWESGYVKTVWGVSNS